MYKNVLVKNRKRETHVKDKNLENDFAAISIGATRRIHNRNSIIYGRRRPCQKISIGLQNEHTKNKK